ncbi:uncharacterized protein LOC106639154 [Copidosoma floridanum]|uniref:uncharacterized protein LOC106639154 n=1 Tax=Copidosoma floridanum TaxID=29053 RepID=UPI0006C968FC|nr:uncharacterized protein LOC106639154 [Copidosoma floridanum]
MLSTPRQQQQQRPPPQQRVRIRGVLFRVIDQVPNDPKIDPPPRACFNCWKVGHVFTDCPLPQRYMCPNCGRREVDLLSCPRCSRTYIEWMEDKRKVNLNDYYWYNKMNKSKKEGKQYVEKGPRAERSLPARRYNRGDEQRKEVMDEVYESARSDVYSEVSQIPSSAGAICCNSSGGSSDLIDKVSRLMELMAPLSASNQNLVMKSIFNNHDPAEDPNYQFGSNIDDLNDEAEDIQYS